MEIELTDDEQLAAAAEAQRRYMTAKRGRDIAVRTASKNGLSYRRIAEAIGLTHSAVQKIVKRPSA